MTCEKQLQQGNMAYDDSHQSFDGHRHPSDLTVECRVLCLSLSMKRELSLVYLLSNNVGIVAGFGLERTVIRP